MTSEIKERIAAINSGIVPEGYKKTKVGIVPVEWKSTNFSEIFTEKVERTNDFSNYPLYSLTIEEGVVPKTDRYERSHLVKKDDVFKIVYTNDFVYNPMNVRFGALARHKGQIPVSVSGYYDVFSVDEKHSIEYMEQFLVSPPMIKYYDSVSTGSLKEKQRVHFSQFLEFYLPIPPLPEQQKIAEILSTQDKLIELHEKKIKQLKKLKKAYLQKMFPKKGSQYPELRFQGFSDAWEQRKLSEISECLDSMRVPLNAEERSKMKGTIPYYGAGNIQDYINQFLFDEELVLLLEDGDAFDDFQTKSIAQYISGKCWVNNHAHILRPKGDAYFLYNSLAHKDIRNVIQLAGASRKKLVQDAMLKIEINIPSVDEQKMIGNFFKEFDLAIVLHQRKLDQEKQKKKSLMQLLLTGKVRVIP